MRVHYKYRIHESGVDTLRPRKVLDHPLDVYSVHNKTRREEMKHFSHHPPGVYCVHNKTRSGYWNFNSSIRIALARIDPDTGGYTVLEYPDTGCPDTGGFTVLSCMLVE